MDAPSWLPLDLLLEVLARSDPVTIARGAAACKLLRRHVTGAGFRARLLRRRDRDRFLLAGLLYRRAWPWLDHEVRASPLLSGACATPPIPVAPRNAADLFDSHYRLVASAGGLLVLTTRREVCVCDAATGERASFPRPAAVTGHLYALLPPDHGLSSFRLLAADEMPLRTQTLSPAAVAGGGGGGGGWRWGPVTAALDLPVLLRRSAQRVHPFPVVLGGGAACYWLYRESLARVYHVVALDAGTGRARSIPVPAACIRRPLGLVTCRDLILASVGGELSLLVAEPTAIVAWTVRLTEEDDGGAAAGRWARAVVVATDAILRSVEAVLPPIACQSVQFKWFGQGSGSVVFQMHGVGLLVLNLRTNRVYHLETSARKMTFDLLWPYELDLLSLIASPAHHL